MPIALSFYRYKKASLFIWRHSCFSAISSKPRFFSDTARSSSLTFMELIKAAINHDNIAIRVEQKSYTYTQLLSSAWTISKLLQEISKGAKNENYPASGQTISGIGNLDGARIGIVAKPSAEFVAGILATWISGGVAVPLALSYPEAELFHVMNDSEISVLLSTEDHKEIMENVASKCHSQFSLIPSVPNVPSKTSGVEQFRTMEVDIERDLLEEIEKSKMKEGDDPALIVYTSGTTGKPKGVVHTHKGITAQVQILTEAWEYSPADQFLHCLPLHHVHGLFNALLAPLYSGSVVEFMPKFSVRGIWQRWRESYPNDGSMVDDAITVFTGVPTMYTRLLQGYEAMDPELQSTSASAARNLRLMMCGSSALPYPVMKHWESITGHRLLERYGMTEFIMALSNPLRDVRKGGTVGKPLPHVQVKIIAESESGDTATGVGELCVKSPSLFKEYWKQPEVTKESFVDGGFFKTGDTVQVDEDGYYIILGHEWWRNFGIDDLELQTLAIRILSQTCSSSGCERNWSVFERIHTKRRNRLEHKRLNDLVYTHYNLRLKERQASRKSLTDPISLENIDLTDDWVVEAEDDDAPLLDVDEIDDWMDVADAILDEGEGGAAAGTSADILKVGGYKLSALEIEAVLLEHPDVAECCVLGLPDKDYGESVCTIIIPEADAKIREQECKPAINLQQLQTWAKERLAPYKIPTRLFLWDSLPRNAMGKVNKKELKKMLQ